ncbi:MAG: TVP38/TMEM64 family protein [Lachnospiraceae bacterium]
MERTKAIMQICTIAGLLACLAFIIYGIQTKIFVSQEALESFLQPFGILAPLIFIGIQIVQVVIPILPGAVGCLGGVLIFGPLWGFVYNYTGICLGSVAIFALSRKYGRTFVQSVVSKRSYNKYIGWLDKGEAFTKAFAAAIFLPVAPDDLLCCIAGLTKMRMKTFLMIIVLGKPMSIFLYSLGLIGIKEWIVSFGFV